MKILYDHQIFYAQKYGGISRYFSEVISHLEKEDGVSVTMPAIQSNNAYIYATDTQKNTKISPFSNLITRLAKSLYSEKKFNNYVKKASQKEMVHHLKKQNFDIFHPTYYNHYFLDHIGNKPFVITIHDMIHEKFPEYFPVKDKVTEYKRLLAKKAAKIIAISENTKLDIVELLHIDEKKIDVVHLGSSFDSVKIPEKPADPIPERYLLFVGLRGIYKNFLFLLESIAEILKKEDMHLLTIGGGDFNDEEKALIERLGISDRLHQYYVSDNELAYLYEHAIAFCFPSLYEGFGLPILESFSNNSPLLLSDSSSFPEIAGDAGIYFNPKDAASIRAAVMSVMDEARRKELIEKGHERLRLFTWEICSRKHLEIYKGLA